MEWSALLCRMRVELMSQLVSQTTSNQTVFIRTIREIRNVCMWLSNGYILSHILCYIYNFILITTVTHSPFDACLNCVLNLYCHFWSYFSSFCVWGNFFTEVSLNFRVSTASLQDICSVCTRLLCWFYLLCLCEIVCWFSTNASNFDEHRRCELKCDSICGFAAACGGLEEFFQIILYGSSQLRVSFVWNGSQVLSGNFENANFCNTCSFCVFSGVSGW